LVVAVAALIAGVATVSPSGAFPPAPDSGPVWADLPSGSLSLRSSAGIASARPGSHQDGYQIDEVLEAIRAKLRANIGQSMGPPGGEVRALVLAPSDPSRLYLGTADGHFYASHDGAASWQRSLNRISHDAVIDNIVVHPDNADLAYAAYWRSNGSGGLLETQDGGTSWDELTVPGRPSIRSLALAPTNPEVIYIGGLGGVWRSSDAGGTWESVGGDSAAFRFVESLAVDPRDPQRVYAGTWRQAYRTLDGGESWRRINSGMAIDRDVFSVTIDPRDPDLLMAGTCNFIYVSESGGNQWAERRRGLALDHNRVHIVAYDPVDPQVLYAGTRGALYRSGDGGETYQIALAQVSVSAISVAPSGTPIFVGTEEKGVMVSTDGTTFKESNSGLDASRVVAFDALPGAPRVLFAARSEGPTQDSVFFSTDVGTTWSELGFGPVLGRVHRIRAQARPVNRVIVVSDNGWWSVRPGGHWLPIDPPPGTMSGLEIAHDVDGLVVAATDQGLYVAQPEILGVENNSARPFDGDAGSIWRPVWQGGALAALTIEGNRYLATGSTHVIAGDLAQTDSGTAVASDGNDAASSGGGADGRRGGLATYPRNGLPEQVVEIALDRQDPNIAYAVADHSAYRTFDGGERWEVLPLPWTAADLRAVAIDPVHPDQVLVLDYRGALYRGHGRGEHWLIMDEDEGLHRAWKLRVSAQAPALALVATQGHGLRVVALDPSEGSQ
jgi:photosystem II stability/assembly factor-like uncharacterized protein